MLHEREGWTKSPGGRRRKRRTFGALSLCSRTGTLQLCRRTETSLFPCGNPCVCRASVLLFAHGHSRQTQSGRDDIPSSREKNHRRREACHYGLAQPRGLPDGPDAGFAIRQRGIVTLLLHEVHSPISEAVWAPQVLYKHPASSSNLWLGIAVRNS